MLIAHFSDSAPLEGTWGQGQRPPRRNVGPGGHTGSDILQRVPLPPPIRGQNGFVCGRVKYACGPSLLRDNKINQFYASRSNMVNQCVSSAVDSCFQVSSKVVKPF